MRSLLFAANWKMHLGPADARNYMSTFLAEHEERPDRQVWFFPPAVSLETVSTAVRGRRTMLAGTQDIYWEPKGAFTGANSAPLAVQAGARAALVGHSERRHVFGETDADTARKVAAALAAELYPLLCVGETLAQRDAGETVQVVTRQLEAALPGKVDPRVTIAYEPVWAIGTGRNATPTDAAEVHRAIRAWLKNRTSGETRILYGGSVNLKNAAELLAERELDGVLVGGASLDPHGWGELVRTGVA
ncbi:MAG TPA: triose-phosphate isomerase [Gemmatimonadales bacterium]|nr:triose-phosphate isomerase [Gemmatimonadales bacterium]